jgi:rhodanese-related sulfurtransferase
MADGIFHELSAQEVDERLASGKAVLIDVREPAEYANERIPGALLLPLSTFDPAHLPADGKEVILHCGGGGRSSRAAGQILASGAAKAAHLAGGLRAWKAAGLPTIAIDPATGQPIEKRSA